MDRIFIPILDESDMFLIGYAQKFINNLESQVIVLDVGGQIKNKPHLKETIRAIEQIAPNHISIMSLLSIDKEFLQQQDLMIVSIESWKELLELKSGWLSDISSTLILDNKIQ
jgi:hypothetical protein